MKKNVYGPQRGTCIQRRKETREKAKAKIKIQKEKKCIVCKKILPSSSFHRDNTVKSGLKGACKVCVKRRDYARYNTWEGYIRKKVVASWKAHGNKEEKTD